VKGKIAEEAQLIANPELQYKEVKVEENVQGNAVNSELEKPDGENTVNLN
jgi:hypothetical protein